MSISVNLASYKTELFIFFALLIILVLFTMAFKRYKSKSIYDTCNKANNKSEYKEINYYFYKTTLDRLRNRRQKFIWYSFHEFDKFTIFLIIIFLNSLTLIVEVYRAAVKRIAKYAFNAERDGGCSPKHLSVSGQKVDNYCRGSGNKFFCSQFLDSAKDNLDQQVHPLSVKFKRWNYCP